MDESLLNLVEVHEIDGITYLKGTNVRATKVVARLIANEGDVAAVMLEFPQLSPDQIRACFEWSESHRKALA